MIYGAGGAMGSAVARAFAREGAKLFFTGRHGASVEVPAREISAAGSSAEAQVLVRPIDTYARSYFPTSRVSTLAEMASVAAFMASDRARGMTGTIVNLSLGHLDD